MDLSTAIVIIAIVAVIAFLIGFIGGAQIAHNSYDEFSIEVDKPATMPCAEVNKVFKECLEVLLIKENLVETKRNQHTVTKSFKFYIKPTDNEPD